MTLSEFAPCVICKKNLITNKVIDGKVQKVFIADQGLSEFMLNNGSILTVCMCKTCKGCYDLHDLRVHDLVIKGCMDGWNVETQILVDGNHWDNKQRNDYLNKMNELSIHSNIDNLDKNKLEDLSKKVSKEK